MCHPDVVTTTLAGRTSAGAPPTCCFARLRARAVTPPHVVATAVPTRRRVLAQVYPDSPSANDEQCNLAQVATIEAALDYLLASRTKSEL